MRPQKASNDGSSNSTAIGVGVGVGVGGALLLGGLAAFLLFRRRKRQHSKASAPPAYSEDEKRAPAQSTASDQHLQQMLQVQEVSADSPIVELPDGDKRVELEDKTAVKGPAQNMPPQELPGDSGQLK
jgi:ABC-type lipoprotein release transport system permease subunit